MDLFYGFIDQIGDSSKDEEKGRYRVRIPSDGIVTGWLYQLKRNSLKNQEDWVYDENEPVVVVLSKRDDYRTGVILGAVNTKNSPQKETDVDIQQMYFEDESYVRYNRDTHILDVFIEGDDAVVNLTCNKGTINVKSKNDLKIDSTDGKVIINGGTNKGIPILEKIENNFNNLKSYVDNQLLAISAGFNAIGTGISSSGPAGNGAFTAASEPITYTLEDMEDTNATH